MTDVLSAAQAAKVIGCSPQKVRERIKRGIWTFGMSATAKQTGLTRASYEVNKHSLAEWLKIPPEEVDRRLEG